MIRCVSLPVHLLNRVTDGIVVTSPRLLDNSSLRWTYVSAFGGANRYIGFRILSLGPLLGALCQWSMGEVSQRQTGCRITGS